MSDTMLLEIKSKLDQILTTAKLSNKYSLTINQTAEYLGVSVRRVRDAIHLKELPASKHGKVYLVRRIDAEKFVDNNKYFTGRKEA